MVNGISISVFIISSSILFAKRFDQNLIIKALNRTGKLALTFYVAHVIIGMGLIEVFGVLKLGEYTLQFSIVYALAFSLLCILFAQVWLKYKSTGPLEFIMRKFTD